MEDHSYNEKELFSRIANGDVVAYKELYTAYYPIVYLTALTYGKSEQLAEDVAQQIFLSVWERRSELPEVGNPGGWFRQAARFQIANALKKEWQKTNYLQNISRSDIDPNTAASKAIENEKRRLLELAISKLPPRQQQVITLSKVEGYTYDMIANELGIGRESVKEHLSRALKTLRTNLRDVFWAIIAFAQIFFW